MKKKKLLVAFVMLLLTGVALTTATYAWFTANTALKLGELDVQVTAANGVQMSTTANPGTWKASLTTDEIRSAAYTGHKNQFAVNFEPVSTVATQSNGLLSMYYGQLQDNGNIDLTLETETATTTGRFVAFDIFVQTTTAQNLYLTASSRVTPGTTNVGLQNSIRVGFADMGTDATNTPTTAQALNQNGGVVIWEPNADQHTTNAVNSGAATNGTTYTYLGATAAGTNIPLNDPLYFGAVTTVKTNTGYTTAPSDVFVTLGAGITKVRIYIWVEGQDVDCENGATLGDAITVKIDLDTTNG
jgi:hypothetical protein